ncbi:MAG: aldehyde dehydrogenase family protein [Acidobacteriota bacterium]
MADLTIPAVLPNQINGEDRPAAGGETFPKLDPSNGRKVCDVARSRTADIEAAIAAAKAAQPAWATKTVVERGNVLRRIAQLMQQHRDELAAIVARETGKSKKDALGETDAAIEMGFFVAGEGRRFYGRTTTSAMPNRTAMTIRQPLGIAGLIIAANTPIANVAWKAFPALLCGNAAIMKASEDTPATAWAWHVLAQEAGLPAGVYNTVHGFGDEAGAPIVEHPDVAVVSFTGSCDVGRWIAAMCGRRMAKVCLELGGKNPFIVCDDADLDLAVQWALGSAFSNAGQRCASGSRILVFDAVYDEFKSRFVAAAKALKVGNGDDDFYGPVINEGQLEQMLAAVDRARAEGVTVLAGGARLTDAAHKDGYYVAPTILENAAPEAEITRSELFGPITCLYRVKGFEDAMQIADDSPFGLTAAIHTRNIHRAMTFVTRIKAGVASINGGTYGSEPHMPFGGLRQSGNGWREAGTEALDVYSDWKTVYIAHNPGAV